MLNKQENISDENGGRLLRSIKKLRSRMGIFAWGAIVVFLIQRGTDVGNLICKIFLGRILPPMDFGAVDPILSTIYILALPAVIIFSTAVKSISRLQSQGLYAQSRALIYDLQRIAVIGSVFSIVVVFLLKDFILTRLHLESSVFIWMIAVMFLISWWGPLVQSIIRAEHRYRLYSLHCFAGPFIVVVMTFILVGYFDFGLEGAIVAKILGGSISVSILVFLVRFKHRGVQEPYTEERVVMMRMMLPMGILIVSEALATNFDRLFVRNFMVEHSAGLSAVFMLGRIPRMIITPISFVIFPVASAEHASGRKVGRLLKYSFLVSVLVTGVCCLLFSVVATPLLNLWHPEFSAYGRYAWVYALVTGLQALNLLVAHVEMARHEYRFLWFYALPIMLACLGLYIARDYTTIAVTLSTLLWTLVVSQAITFISITTYIARRSRSSSE